MNKYDVVIIGAGIGGLVSGAILSKEGFNVCIIEKHSRLGGAIQGFVRDGTHFDVGAHYIGSLDKNQALNQYFSYLGVLDRLDLYKLNETGFDQISFLDNGKDYLHAMGKENFISQMKEYFPNESNDIDNYYKNLEDTIKIFPLMKKPDQTFDFFRLPYKQSIGLKLDELSENSRLKSVLAGNSTIYAGEKYSSPLYIHNLIQYSYIESAYRLRYGAGQLADKLGEIIKENGGTVLKNSLVSEIKLKDSHQVEKVMLEDGTEIFADNFFSNLHPSVTAGMIKDIQTNNKYWNRLESLDNTISIFSVYMVFKENTVKYNNYNQYLLKENNAWIIDSFSENSKPEGCMIFSTPDKNMKYAKGMAVLCYMRYSELNKWINTTVENRGNEYKDFKAKKTEDLIDFVEQKIPNIRSSIKKTYSATPLTYRDYTGIPEGALYGIRRDCNDIMRSIIFPKSKLNNLFFVGQNTTMHGVLGVTIGAFLACSHLLPMDKILDNSIKENR